MPTLIATSGAANANSFVTLTEAETYFDSRPDSEGWDSAGATERERALIYAAKQLQGMNWLGDRVDTVQALAWPRFDVDKPDSWGCFDSDEIPQQVKDAQCELALSVIENGIDAVGGQSDDGVTSFAGSGISVQYGRGGGSVGSGARSRVDALLADLTCSGVQLMRA